MTTRCKFQCQSVKKMKAYNSPSYVYEASFSAVASESEENKHFFEFTPSGSIQLRSYKEDVFEVGQEYYVDFTGSLVPKE